jgi:MscS family membrane protein
MKQGQAGSVQEEMMSFLKKQRLSLLLIAIVTASLYAQAAPQPLNKLTTQATKPPASGVAQFADPLGRNTPRGTVVGFLQAAQGGDYRVASDYMQLTLAERKTHGEELARQLQLLLNSNFPRRIDQISDLPEGIPEADLPADRQRIGAFTTDEGEVPVYLVRMPETSVGRVWLFSAETIARVPELAEQARINQFEHRLPQMLVRTSVFNTPLWVWGTFLGLIPVAAGAGWLLIQFVRLPRRAWRRAHGREVEEKSWLRVPSPWWLITSAFLHRIGVYLAGIPLLYRFYYGHVLVIVLVFGLTWLLLRAITYTGSMLQRRVMDMGRAAAGSFVVLGQRVVKVLLVLIAVLTIFSRLGVKTDAALAGLGIGGLAVAFAAQKTLENLFGGASVLGDEVIRVGDVVKVGDLVGTVEDIGLRSTRIRTPERTQLSVPNGSMATMNIENLTLRDKRLLQTTLGLRYETSTDQLRYVLAEIRRMLYAHPSIESDTVRVRFVGFGQSSLDVEIFSYVLTTDHNAYMAVREDLLLRMMDIVQQAGSSLAFPSQTLYMTRDYGVDREAQKSAVQAVNEWRQKNELPFPDFSPEAISKFEDSIIYPDPASSLRR